MTSNQDYTISPARYSKGKVVVRCPSRDGFKTRAARLAEGLRGRWTHRAGGYVMTPAKAARFERLYAEGWDASCITGELEAPVRELPLPGPADDDLVTMTMQTPGVEAREEQVYAIPAPPAVVTYRHLRGDMVPVLRRCRVLRAALRDVAFSERNACFVREILARATRQREAGMPALLVARAAAQPYVRARAANLARQREICGTQPRGSLQNHALADASVPVLAGGSL